MDKNHFDCFRMRNLTKSKGLRVINVGSFNRLMGESYERVASFLNSWMFSEKEFFFKQDQMIFFISLSTRLKLYFL